MKETLAAYGMAGLFPLDNSFDPAGFPDPKDLEPVRFNRDHSRQL
jgi:hypothetical protein